MITTESKLINRLYVVGTDTAVGKTALVCALLHTASRLGHRVVPFKPAQSGSDQPSDIERLLTASRLPQADTDLACPLRYRADLAPGIAEDPSPFLGPTSTPDSDPPHHPTATPLDHATEALDHWQTLHPDALILIEGAGGLHVPMPGGTWQAKWITRLVAHTIVVGRAGLGTINHTLATIEGLRAAGRPPLGFFLSQTVPTADCSVTHNAQIIATASGRPHLGTLPFTPEPAFVPDLLHSLMTRLPNSDRHQAGEAV